MDSFIKRKAWKNEKCYVSNADGHNCSKAKEETNFMSQITCIKSLQLGLHDKRQYGVKTKNEHNAMSLKEREDERMVGKMGKYE